MFVLFVENYRKQDTEEEISDLEAEHRMQVQSLPNDKKISVSHASLGRRSHLQ